MNEGGAENHKEDDAYWYKEDDKRERKATQCRNGCGRLAAEGYAACCRTCTDTNAGNHGPRCNARQAAENEWLQKWSTRSILQHGDKVLVRGIKVSGKLVAFDEEGDPIVKCEDGSRCTSFAQEVVKQSDDPVTPPVTPPNWDWEER